MTDISEVPGHLIRRYHQASVAIFNNEVSNLGYDITPVQYAVLAKIETNSGIDQATLAGLIAYDRTTITGVVDRLELKKLLIREVSDTDRRARVLKLTDEGIRVLHEVSPAVKMAQKIMLRGLNESEAKEFMRLLSKATEAVNDLSRAPLKEPN